MPLLGQLAGDLSFALGSLLAQKFAAEHSALKLGGAVVAAIDPMEALGLREQQVLKMAVEGHSSKEIASHLSLAATSVDNYRSRLMTKLDVPDVTALVRFAIRNGTLPPQEGPS